MLRIFSLLLLSVALASSEPSKIETKLLNRNAFETFNVFVTFTTGIDIPLSNVVSRNIADRGQRATEIYNVLSVSAQDTQKEAKYLLTKIGFPLERATTFWINNKLYLKEVDLSTILALASLSSVASITEEIVAYLKRPIIESVASPRDASILAEWNVEKMGAHLVWDAPWGNNGSGVTVGFIDTGVRGTHEAIRDQYVNDGKAWRDPYNQYSVPTDVYNHGTHTVGSVLGKFGIGMAPAARWIACKGYRDDGSAYESAFAECGQFMVCPTDSSGNNPDCSKSPQVTSNSWGVWPGTNFFEDILDVWRSIGIIPLFSMGNEGPECSDVLSPADSTKAIGVGATGRNDELASFSSRGPSRYGVIKPDFSAPGMSIRSCDCNGDTLYASFSGTSMSCPNAAGVVALMVGKRRDVSYDTVYSIFRSTAVRSEQTTGEVCGGIPDYVWPNNRFGHGRLDAYAAVMQL